MLQPGYWLVEHMLNLVSAAGLWCNLNTYILIHVYAGNMLNEKESVIWECGWHIIDWCARFWEHMHCLIAEDSKSSVLVSYGDYTEW